MTSTARLEHVNLTVSDPHRTAAMLEKLCGWHVRWEGPAKNDGYTVHVGSDSDYLALYALPEGAAEGDAGVRFNHVGLLVDDLDEARGKVRAEGYEPFNEGCYDPGCRFYFLDHDGVEFEVISYA